MRYPHITHPGNTATCRFTGQNFDGEAGLKFQPGLGKTTGGGDGGAAVAAGESILVGQAKCAQLGGGHRAFIGQCVAGTGGEQAVHIITSHIYRAGIRHRDGITPIQHMAVIGNGGRRVNDIESLGAERQQGNTCHKHEYIGESFQLNYPFDCAGFAAITPHSVHVFERSICHIYVLPPGLLP